MPDPNTLSTREIADEIGATASKIKNWTTHFAIPHDKDSKGHRRYSPEVVELFRQIGQATQDGHGYATIRRVLSLVPGEGQAVAEDSAPCHPVPVDTDARVWDMLDAERERAEALMRELAEAQALAAAASERARLCEQFYQDAHDLVRAIEAGRARPMRPWWKIWG